MAILQPKVQEIARDLKVTSKEIIEKLAEMKQNVKGPSSPLDEVQLGLIFDIFTSLADMGDEPIVKPEKPKKKKKKRGKTKWKNNLSNSKPA